MNRSRSTTTDVGSKSTIEKVAMAAISADPANSFRKSTRSGSAKTALTSVPTTKPACTALVSSASWVKERCHEAFIAPIDALVEYHGSKTEEHGRWTVYSRCRCGTCYNAWEKAAYTSREVSERYVLVSADVTDSRVIEHVRRESFTVLPQPPASEEES